MIRVLGAVMKQGIALMGGCTLLLGAALTSASAKPAFEIWLDGDFTNHLESSRSIEMGAKAAIHDHGGKVLGRDIVIFRKDHRGSSKRSLRNIKNFIKNPNGIAMMSGIHSPPLLAHRDFINQSKVLFLVPWAAAGPITRGSNHDNFIFRLSIDDSQAGGFIAQYASETLKSKKPCLLLEETGWGKSNFKNMTEGLRKNNVDVWETIWFRWGLKSNVAHEIANRLYDRKCDLVLLVANSKEGALLVQSVGSFSDRKVIPILSHWGITGGNFHEVVSHDIRSKVNLRFIQTNFNFNQIKTPKGLQVLETFKKLYNIKSPSEIRAGTGASHAYDLVSIVLNQLKHLDPNKSTKELSHQLKERLESKEIRFQGLLKNYHKPFTKYSGSNPNAHEALEKGDYSIGFFDSHGVIWNVTGK